MQKGEFVDALVRCGAVQFGDLALASGKASDWYCVIKGAVTISHLLQQTAKTPRCTSALWAWSWEPSPSLEPGLPQLTLRTAKNMRREVLRGGTVRG